ncbi:hypothetical protein FA014_02065 [Cellulomonas hominis]|uniref:Uncharacterized protein n=1 Tax=Cellulomonas hominis TaxID=156981 RepID=A0A7Z8NR83_9CELL|nr:hypothetical protein [Cellulomonas hominis]TKR27165.1 hypothetical protein FA014_02065 [Cellulomonas hominis]
MASFGYRAYRFEIVRSRTQEPLDLTDETLVEKFRDVLNVLASSGTIFGDPGKRLPPTSVDGERVTQPTLTVASLIEVSPLHLHALIMHGEQGLHESYAEPGSESRNIAAGSAQAAYRVDFLLPRSGTSGVLVAEVISNRDVTKLLKSHFVHASRAIRESERNAHKVRARELRKQGERSPSMPDLFAIDLQIYRLADPEQIRGILMGAKKTEAVFSQHETSAVDGSKVVRKRELRVLIETPLEVESTVDRVSNWVDRFREGTSLSTAEAVLEMEQDLNLEDLDLDFDDVGVVVTPVNGSPRLFGPGFLKEIFTYQLGARQPSMLGYYRAVLNKVVMLAGVHQIELSLRSAEEVAECLLDSAPENSVEASRED